MTARILIVDDVPANIRVLKAKLAAEYYQVSYARDGIEALQIAQGWQPDLILLDVLMPGMDGYDCCKKLKESLYTLHIPVVMITCLDSSYEKLRGLESGADDFLTKPIDYATLMIRVLSLVRVKRLLDELGMRNGDIGKALGIDNDHATIPSVSMGRILFVDDLNCVAQSIQNAMVIEDIISASVVSSVDAVAIATKTKFNLIVIELPMRNKDPLTLISVLRACENTYETPVLLVGNAEEKDQMFRSAKLGANDWLFRPIDLREFGLRALNQIRRKLYRDRLRDDLRLALEMALIDPLTGLYNQRYLDHHFECLRRKGRHKQIALLMIDVDHFKSINDHFGHAEGDRVLRLIANILRDETRVFDSVVRYGGEEFVIVMPEASSNEAIIIAERMRSAVEALVLHTNHDCSISLAISIGIAYSDDEDLPSKLLLQLADTALYTAKQKGRNRVEIS